MEADSLSAGTMQLKKGSTRLRRVVCGVSPQTSFHHFFSLGSEEKWFDEIDGGTPSMARETRALPQTPLHRSVSPRYNVQSRALHKTLDIGL